MLMQQQVPRLQPSQQGRLEPRQITDRFLDRLVPLRKNHQPGIDPETGEQRPRLLRLRLLEAQVINNPKLSLLLFYQQQVPERAFAYLPGNGRYPVPFARAEGPATADKQRRLDITMAGPAGPLLPVNLSRAPGNMVPAFDMGVPLTAIDRLLDNHLVNQSLPRLLPEQRLRQGDLPHLFLLMIVNLKLHISSAPTARHSIPARSL